MRRLPTRHRATSILNFADNKWSLPVQHRKDPAIDPFEIPRQSPANRTTSFWLQPQDCVSVWLLRNDVLMHVQDVPERHTLLLPSQCSALKHFEHELEPERLTYATLTDGHQMVARDRWQSWSASRSLLQPYHGSVIFASSNGALADRILGGESDVVMTVDSCSPDISSAFASLPAPSNGRSWSSRTNAETFHGRAHEKRELCAEKKVRFVEQDGTPGASTSSPTTISGTPSTLGTSSTTCSAIPQTMKELSHQDPGSTNHLLRDARRCKAATFGLTADTTVGPPKTSRAAQVFDMTVDEHLHAVEPTEHCVNLLSDSSSPSSFVGSDHRWLKIASGATDGISPGPGCQGPGRAIQSDDIAYKVNHSRTASMSSLEEDDYHHPHAPPKHPTRDVDGIPDSEDSGAGGDQAPREQAQEEQRLGSRSQSPHGHRQTFVQIGCPKRMELCRGGLRARSGLPETSRRSWPLLVHLPAMRGKMGTIGNFAIKLLDFFGGRTSQGQAQQTSLPERSATTKVPTGPSRAESGDQGQGQRPVADCTPWSSSQEPECTNGTPSWTSDGHGTSMPELLQPKLLNDGQDKSISRGDEWTDRTPRPSLSRTDPKPRALPVEHGRDVTHWDQSVRMGGRHDGLRGGEDSGSGSGPRPKLDPGAVRPDAQPVKLKAQLVHSHHLASKEPRLCQALGSLPGMAMILLCSFAAATNSVESTRHLPATSDEVPELMTRHYEVNEPYYRSTGEHYIEDKFTYQFSDAQNWKHCFEHLPCLLGQPTHLFFCTDEKSETWQQQRWNSETDDFLQVFARQYPSFCWVYPTTCTTSSLAHDLDWNQPAQNHPTWRQDLH